VFCLQCGAEAPARAVLCPTCGHDLGRSSADLRSSPVLADAPLEAGVTHSGPGAAVLKPGVSPSIRPGDLDRPGLPQDTRGRVLLAVLLAMAVDLFLPWAVVFGQHETLPQTAGFAIVFLLLLAGLPLMHPKLRRNTISAALPILIGGACLGLGVTYWLNLTQSQPAQFFTGSASIGSQPHLFAVSPAGPDFGLVGFLVGGATLAIVGYYLLVEAARAPFLAAAPQQASSQAEQPAGPRLAAVSATGGELAPAEPAKQNSSGAENREQRDTKPSKDSTPQIALPGSDAWTRTLEPPTFVRPKVGAIRRTNR
jgi:hypothetical protein